MVHTNTATGLVSIIPELTHRHSAITTSHYALGIGIQSSHQVQGSAQLSEDHLDYILQPRMDVEHRVSRSWTAIVGGEDKYIDSRMSLNERQYTGSSSGEILHETSISHFPGIYSRNIITIPDSAWSFTPGLRLDYFSPSGQLLAQPRAGIRYVFERDSSIRMSGGLYSQPAQSEEAALNPALKAPEAWHLTLSMDHEFLSGPLGGLSASIGTFYKQLMNLIVSDTLGYDNSGGGRAYGLEAMFKLDKVVERLARYTLSRSTRWDPLNGGYLADFDQTHNLNLVSSFFFPSNWTLSTRVRFVTGDPYTPFSGAILDSDNQSFSPAFGPANSARFGSFFQWDLKPEKRWIGDQFIFSAYFDVQNITNTNNQTYYVSSVDDSQIAFANGLPILPTFGLRMEF